MVEYDLILMSLVIFAPLVFALGLLFFPRGSEEWMRWWSLLGTAVTLVLSLCLFVDFTKMLDNFQGQGNVNERTGLLARNDEAVRKYQIEDMVRGECLFAATGVTDGRMLRGVQFGRAVIETETVVMRSVTGTVRYIKAEHRQLDKFHLD